MKVTITAAAHAAIVRHARGEYRDDGVRNPDGTYTINLDDEVLERLTNLAPDPSDAILRVTSGKAQ